MCITVFVFIFNGSAKISGEIDTTRAVFEFSNHPKQIFPHTVSCVVTCIIFVELNLIY